MLLTYKYRIKDASATRYLQKYARACNRVWNFCVETQKTAENKRRAGSNVFWPSNYDLHRLTSGTSKNLGLCAQTIQKVCHQFTMSRDQFRKCPKYRASKGPKKSLGWIPFTNQAVKINKSSVKYMKRSFYFWKSREIEGRLIDGVFIEDARGRWYVCFRCEVGDKQSIGSGQIGIDLGLKTLATCSDGTIIENPRHLKKYEIELAKSQRARNKPRTRAIYAKIKNSRRDFLHKESTKLVRENSLIVVGNISSSKLAQTRFAKSVYDAGWSMLRTMLEYKASRHRVEFIIADEKFTSRRCSTCQDLSGPKGIEDLGIRHWTCSGCGTSHDRDVNAAQNILDVGTGRCPPVEGILDQKVLKMTSQDL